MEYFIMFLIVASGLGGYYYARRKGAQELSIFKDLSELKEKQLRHLRVLLPFLKQYFSRYGDTYETLSLNMAKEFLVEPMGGQLYAFAGFKEGEFPIEFPDIYRPRGVKVPVMTKFRDDIDDAAFDQIDPLKDNVITVFDSLIPEDEKEELALEKMSNKELYWLIFFHLILHGVLSWEYQEQSQNMTPFPTGGPKKFIYNYEVEAEAFPESRIDGSTGPH